jgi:hypothetical protein
MPPFLSVIGFSGHFWSTVDIGGVQRQGTAFELTPRDPIWLDTRQPKFAIRFALQDRFSVASLRHRLRPDLLQIIRPLWGGLTSLDVLCV